MQFGTSHIPVLESRRRVARGLGRALMEEAVGKRIGH